MTQPDWNARVSTALAALRAAGMRSDYASLSAAIHRLHRKLFMMNDYRPSSRLLSSTPVTLVKASGSIVQLESIGPSYGLNSLCDGTVDVHVVNGTHDTFVTSSEGAAEVASIINAVR